MSMLFDKYSEPMVADSAPNENLNRVKSRIGQAIMEFRQLKGTNIEWHADELRQFVDSRSKSAPGSPDRILRIMRKEGDLNYIVVNRRQSLYKFV